MNKLIIKDTEKFDQEVWNTKTYFTKKDYNEWLQNATRQLEAIYDLMENKYPSETNTLGDIINLLNNTEIEIKK